MPIIIREYRCNDCGGTFESSDPVEEVACPACSAREAERVFLTPPGIKSPQTSGKDRTLDQLATDYGLSNMTNRDGAPVKRAPAPEAGQFAAQTPQTMAVLQKLGGSGDGFSSVLPALQSAGRPHQWRKVRERS